MSRQHASFCSSRAVSSIGAYALLLGYFLTGCGDVGIDGDPQPPNVGETGYVVGAVQGLDYQTDSMLGVTGPRGEFSYEEGERVRFFLGSAYLGETEGKSEVTVFDIAGIEPITNGWRGADEAGSAFKRAVNMLVAFETFDYDGDPDNGIEIGAEVTEAFGLADVNLDAHAWGFRRDPRFRGVLNELNDRGLLADHRAPRGPAPALNRLYDLLGIESGLFANQTYSEDLGNDGVIDETYYSEYDADGFRTYTRQTSAFHDQHQSWFESNDWGQHTRATTDDYSDGSIDSISTYEFDEDGNSVRIERDTDNDGRPDYIQVREYDAFGRETRAWTDQNADGRWESVSEAVYDDEARTVLRSEDSNADGVTDTSNLVFFTLDGQRRRRVSDSNGDGIADRISEWEYDERGNQSVHYSDSNGDGSWDRIIEYEHDARGRQIRFAEDRGGDGTVDYVTTQTFDAEGRRLRWEADRGADGSIDEVRWHEYVDDRLVAYGVTLHSIFEDDNADGVIDYATYEYLDAHGELVRREQDHSGDGVIDVAYEYTKVAVGWGNYFSD